MDCPLPYIIAHTCIHASYLFTLYIYIIHQVHYFTQESSCIWPFITLVRHICICYTSYIRPLRASLYYATHTTKNNLYPYSKTSILHQIWGRLVLMKCLTALHDSTKWFALHDSTKWCYGQLHGTVCYTTLANDGTVSCKAHNIHCLQPQIASPTKSTHYVPELT